MWSDTTEPEEDARRRSENDAQAFGCIWWHPGYMPRNDIVCSSNNLIRASTNTLAAAMQRAKRCSATGNSLIECILAHEVGLGIPGFYVHDANCSAGEMRAVLAPTMAPIPPENAIRRRRVRVRSRVRSIPSVRTYNETVRLQYIGGKNGDMHLETHEFHGVAAFCYQMLLESIPGSC